MQTAALRHRPESEDCFLINKEQMKVRLHTGKDIKEVRVYYADVHEPLEKKRELSLTLAGHGQVQDYWEGTLTLPLRLWRPRPAGRRRSSLRGSKQLLQAALLPRNRHGQDPGLGQAHGLVPNLP